MRRGVDVADGLIDFVRTRRLALAGSVDAFDPFVHDRNRSDDFFQCFPRLLDEVGTFDHFLGAGFDQCVDIACGIRRTLSAMGLTKLIWPAYME